MRIYVHESKDSTNPRALTHAPGPGDLRGVGEGDTLVVFGPPATGREAARWAGAIGSAVIRGAAVRHR